MLSATELMVFGHDIATYLKKSKIAVIYRGTFASLLLTINIRGEKYVYRVFIA